MPCFGGPFIFDGFPLFVLMELKVRFFHCYVYVRHGLVIMFGDTVNFPANFMSVSQLVTTVKPGFATYVACVILGRTMFPAKTVMTSTIFASLSVSSITFLILVSTMIYDGCDNPVAG